jgi:hypothetical protein
VGAGLVDDRARRSGVHPDSAADPIPASRFGGAAWVWNVLHQQGVFMVYGMLVVAAYPLVPWMFVMALGYCFGSLVTMDPVPRRRWIHPHRRWGDVRVSGDSRGQCVWRPLPQSTEIPGMTVLSFLRVAKYPPSLDFLLMTLGPALLLLALFDGRELAPTNPMIVFGRVPLFYFLVHFFAIHLLTIPFALVSNGHAGFLFNAPPYPAEYGYSLGVVYWVWIGVVVMVYPLCLWFSRLKQRRNDWWLGYL